MTRKLILNTRRILGNESRTKSVVDSAVLKGIDIFDCGGSQQVQRLPKVKKRIIAKIGYYERDESVFESIQGARLLSDSLGHCLEPSFIEAETQRLQELTQIPPIILLHHPETADGTWRQALDRLFSMRRAGLDLHAIGVASGDVAWLRSNTNDLLRFGASVLRLPACALDSPQIRDDTAELGRQFELVGIRPLLSTTPVHMQLVDHPNTEGVDRGATQRAYFSACEAIVQHLTPPEDADEDTRAGADWLLQLVADLNESVTKMTPSAWEYELSTQIGPMIHNKFDGLDDQTADLLFKFFQNYGKLVSITAQDCARAAAASPPTGVLPIKPDQPLAEWALRHVFHQRPELTYISLAVESTNDIDVALRVAASSS